MRKRINYKKKKRKDTSIVRKRCVTGTKAVTCYLSAAWRWCQGVIHVRDGMPTTDSASFAIG